MSRINSNPTLLASKNGDRKSGRVRLITGPVKVDNEDWYQVSGSSDVIQWVKTQDKNQWAEVIDHRNYIYGSAIDVHERVFMLLVLKYSID